MEKSEIRKRKIRLNNDLKELKWLRMKRVISEECYLQNKERIEKRIEILNLIKKEEK